MHISFLAEQGVPLEAIQDRVGHTGESCNTNLFTRYTED